MDYEKLIERIAKLGNLGIDEIDRRVIAKRAKLSGLISKEGAAQVIAAELGINLDKEKVKINEIVPGMRKINLMGKIIQLFPVRQYKKDNREGKIGSFIVADENSNIRVVLWDTNHIALIENNSIKQGDFVEISNANLRGTELHLTGFSNITISNERIDSVKEELVVHERKLEEVKVGEQIKARAFIVQTFTPRFFYQCPECNGRVVQDPGGFLCEKHGRVTGNKRALLTLIIDDGTNNLRAVLFSEQIEKLGLSLDELENPELFSIKKMHLIGKEMYFSGTIRQNKIFNNNEIFVSDIGDVDVEKLIEVLEKRQ